MVSIDTVDSRVPIMNSAAESLKMTPRKASDSTLATTLAVRTRALAEGSDKPLNAPAGNTPKSLCCSSSAFAVRPRKHPAVSSPTWLLRRSTTPWTTRPSNARLGNTATLLLLSSSPATDKP